ncbi:MAG: HU family DNA-binding protein [Bacteroidales bacterium]
MSIKYKFVNWNDNVNPDGEKKSGYFPQVVRRKTVGIKNLALNITRGKISQAIEEQASILRLLNCLEKELLEGNSVCFEGFGTFSLTAQSKHQITDPKKFRAESIEVKRVVFNPSSALMRRLKNAKFEKESA